MGYFHKKISNSVLHSTVKGKIRKGYRRKDSKTILNRASGLKLNRRCKRILQTTVKRKLRENR